MRRDRIDLMGGTLLVAFSGLMGLNQVMIKLVNAGMPAVLQAGLRSAAAILPVLIFAIIARRRLSLTDGSFFPGLLSGVFFAIEFYLLFHALNLTSVSRASIFFYSMPVWVALVAHFMIPQERLTPRRVLGMVLAMAGIVLALSQNAAPASDRALIGDLMCLLASLSWAAIALIARLTPFSRASPEMQLLYQLTVSAPLLIGFAVIAGATTLAMTPGLWGIFSVQVILVVCVGFLTWFWVLSVYPASDMTAFAFLAPVFGVLLGWLFLDEPVSPSIIGALVLVAIGIVLVARR